MKSAFTRLYNKETSLLPFASSAGVSKKKIPVAETNLLDDEEEETIESDKGDADDVTTDAMIKV